MIPLGIAMDYRVKWSMHRIIRDFVQNFYDSIGCERSAEEFQYEWEVVEVEEAIMDKEDLAATAEFQKVLLKYMSACMCMYGTERSERSNGMLTYIGTILYRTRDSIEEYEEKWNQIKSGHDLSSAVEHGAHYEGLYSEFL